jgi:hypothetical protein
VRGNGNLPDNDPYSIIDGDPAYTWVDDGYSHIACTLCPVRIQVNGICANSALTNYLYWHRQSCLSKMTLPFRPTRMTSANYPVVSVAYM